MIIDAIATGKTVEEAKEKALQQLGSAVENVEVDFEIIDMPKPKTLGLFGGSDAKVRVFAESYLEQSLGDFAYLEYVVFGLKYDPQSRLASSLIALLICTAFE